MPAQSMQYKPQHIIKHENYFNNCPVITSAV